MEFFEATAFTKHIYAYMDDEEFSTMQWFLVFNPEFGDLINGGGGLRKLRWQGKGKGKRGGVRIIYYYVNKREEILLLSVFAKNELEDLPKVVLAQLRKEIKNV
jgi:mRNA-degrading endonuclease RelE of RelBE toxin-antitoxin system